MSFNYVVLMELNKHIGYGRIPILHLDALKKLTLLEIRDFGFKFRYDKNSKGYFVFKIKK